MFIRKQYYLHSGIEITSFKNLYGDENHVSIN